MIAHDVHTYISARSVGMRDMPVRITPYTYHSVDRDAYNTSYGWEMREGALPMTVSDHPINDEREYYHPHVVYHQPEDGYVSTLEVLALYSAEPDWGMDEGLQLSPLQVFTAGSQGYRHLRYGWFLLRAGVAHHRAFHFSELAEHAFLRGDTYWGLRFSGRALHYIQDLLTPYHLKPIPEWYWVPRLFRLREVFNTIYTYHQRFEGYTGYHLRHGSDKYIRCIESSRPHAIVNLRRDLMKTSRRVRMLFYKIFRECRMFWGEGLSKTHMQLHREWIERHGLPEQLNLLIYRWLHLLSRFIKGYIMLRVVPHLQEGVLCE
jgi:hypothetical protein